jgi:2-(1,2-epoxy-1,2-dihydrophenyl)acetyl-CoA isomerase
MAKIEWTVADGVATVTLNRPEVLNALDREAKASLLEALRAVDRDAGVRVVVLRGAGRAFCAGEDLKSHVGEEGRSLGESLREGYNPIVRRLRDLSKPTIAQVNGVAAGAGFSLALACDLRVASSEARFISVFSNIALVPDSGLSYHLPRLMGLGRALEAAFTARPIPADEALALGLVNRVVPPAELDDAVAELAGRLAHGPTQAYVRTRQAMLRGLEVSLDELLDYEAALQELQGRTADHREGVAAFLEKRPPRFQGR